MIDFGSVKSVISQSQSNETQVSTPGYTPPEQMLGDPQFKSDIYALGKTAIQMITGLEPRNLGKSKKGEVSWRDEVEEEFRTQLPAIIDRMVRSDTKRRYQSVDEVLKDVKDAGKTKIAVVSQDNSDRGGNFKLINQFGLALVGVGIVSSVLGFILYSQLRIPKPVPPDTPVEPLVAAQAESKTRLTDEKIRDVAQLITVRVYSVDDEHWEKGTIEATSGSGSGILLERKKLSEQNLYHYLVLTNEHVLREEEQYDTYVKTPDGLLHRAYNHKAANEKFDEGKVDLGLLWFLSPLKYEIAKPEESESLLEKDSDTFIAGFPCSETSIELECPAEYYFTPGKGGEVDQPLQDGYQIYFDNKTKEGTSGGPILNAQGRLIGINGRGTNTPNSSQYSYADGKGVSGILRDKSPGLGIPFRTYRKIAPKEPFQDIELSDKDIVSREVVVVREIAVNPPPENREDMNFSLLEFLSLFLIVALILYLIFSSRSLS